jgi:hypothetical protein
VATLTEALKELAVDIKLEGEVEHCPRLEPFLEIHLEKDNQTCQETNEDTRSQARHGGKGWRNGTYNVGMIKAMEHPYLTLHTLLIALDFILHQIGL